MTGEYKQSCEECRFGTLIGKVGGSILARCGWVDRSQDEAGDRMPEWAHEILRESPVAVGNDDRAETCPAFEATSS